jgi:GNAT superfamily N-acetyltransferase
LLLGIRAMTIDDIPVGLRLKEQAGWNQLAADWRRLLDLQPDGCFLAEMDGLGVGTVTTCRFGPVAWIAMMLVDEAYRSRGIGRALMTRALAELDSRNVRSVRLDATPRGRPMYESLGFVEETTLDRYVGVLLPADESPGVPEPRSVEGLDGVIALDREVSGTDRDRLIRRFAREYRGSLRVVGDGDGVDGYLMARPGSTARQIGPCIADERAGPRLLADARSRYAGEAVVLDVPTANAPASALVGSWGLRAARVLIRMGRGPRVEEDLSRIWAGSGPEKG